MVIFFLTSCARGPLEQAIQTPKRQLATATPRSLQCFQLAKNLLNENPREILSRETISLTQVNDRVRPTQFHYGSPRVDLLLNRFASWNKKKIQKFLTKRPVPYVLGPDGKYHIIDRHHVHRALSAYREKMQKRGIDTDQFQITYERVADFSHLERDEFHEQMIQRKWMFPYYKGQFRNPDQLPQKANELDKDFYRGLAWIVRKGGGYKKTDTPFAEFYWGEYFRENLQLPPDQEDFAEEVILRAIKLSLEDNSSTRELPGFIPGRQGLSAKAVLLGSTKKLEEIGLSFGHVDLQHSFNNILPHIVFGQNETSKLQIKAWRKKLKGKKLSEIQKLIAQEKIPYVQGPMGKKWILSHSSLLKALFMENDDLIAEGKDLSELMLHFREIEDMSHVPFDDFKAYLKEHGFLEKNLLKKSKSDFVKDPRFLEETKPQDLLYLAKLVKAAPKNLSSEDEGRLAKKLHKAWVKRWSKDKKIKPKRAVKFFKGLSKEAKTQKNLVLKDPPYKTKKIVQELKND